MHAHVQASAFMVAAGVAAAALAGRAILRQARGGGAAGASLFQHFTGATGVGGAQKGFDEPMTRVEASKILGIRCRRPPSAHAVARNSIASPHACCRHLSHGLLRKNLPCAVVLPPGCLTTFCVAGAVP